MIKHFNNLARDKSMVAFPLFVPGVKYYLQCPKI